MKKCPGTKLSEKLKSYRNKWKTILGVKKKPSEDTWDFWYLFLTAHLNIFVLWQHNWLFCCWSLGKLLKKFRMLEPESHPRLPQHAGKLSEISVFIGRSPVHCSDTVQKKISKKKSNRFSWFFCIDEGISLGHTLL